MAGTRGRTLTPRATFPQAPTRKPAHHGAPSRRALAFVGSGRYASPPLSVAERHPDPTLRAAAGVSPSRTFLPELESLRGVAILLVFFFHADGILTPDHAAGTFPSPLLAYVHAGHVGV